MSNNIYTLISTNTTALIHFLAEPNNLPKMSANLQANTYSLTSAGPVKANALVITPEPNKAISKQVQQTVIEDLANPNLLKSQYLEMYISSLRNPVMAKADGTFCYGSRSAEFAAVSVFLSLSKQLQVYLDLGLRKPKRPLAVIINDPFVPDNAYFNPEHYELHIGVGTGVKNGGLTRNLALDLGVANHEFGHALLFLQTLDTDLPGKQGAAIHEAVADVLGALVMDYLTRLWSGNGSFNFDDLKNDRRIIGKYALPPLGIRSQKNNKRYPDDLVGEPHADGLIVGGALSDLLVTIASQSYMALEDQIKLFTRLSLLALALLPNLKVTFKDLLRAYIIADRQICKGKYRQSIEQCFGTHGITLNTSAAALPANTNIRMTKYSK